jgi:predicted acetyltransferase
MGEMVRLVKPSAEYEQAYRSFYEDWMQSGEDIVPWVVEKDPADFAEMLAFLYAQDSEEKLMSLQADKRWVPHSTYWLLNEAGVLVGAVNIRHRLNEQLLNSGGHIGYGIRPSQRRKGFAKQLLALALQQTDELGISQVLLVCDRGNMGSQRTIVANGGTFDSEYTEADGNVVGRFWIQRNLV